MPSQLSGPAAGPRSGGAPKQIVLLLHGFGSNGADLIGLAPHWQGALPDALFLAPNAPERCPGAPGGYQWWSLATYTPQALAAGAARAAPALDAYIDAQLAQHGLDESRLALVGFSQGTMMALHAGPRRARQIAGILGYSGAVTGEAALAQDVASRPPVLLVHGTADAVVPFAAMQAARATLERLDFAVDTHASPGLGHSIDMDGLRLGGEFLRRMLVSA